MSSTLFLKNPPAPALAYCHQSGTEPGIMFLPGFRSDMFGNKAQMLADYCAARGRAYTRFDYRGHGQSEGQFLDATGSDWITDAVAILDHCTSGRLILVGSSMGGWIMLHLARRRPERVVGVVGIAPAADFAAGMRDRIPEDGHRQLAENGVYLAPSQYSEDPYPITQRLLDDAPKHSLLDKPLHIDAPVRLLHGQQDPDVPWQGSLILAEKLQGGNVEICLIKDGDHRLSRQSDLALLAQTLDRLTEEIANPEHRSS